VTSESAVQSIIEVLGDADVAHMFVGSLASNFHGIPRSTQDADVVVDLGPAALDWLWPRIHDRFEADPQTAFETVTGTLRVRLHVPDSAFAIDLFGLSDDAHDVERFRRRVPVRLLDRQTFVASAEDIVVTKLRWARQGTRPKDLDDIRNIIAVRGDDLDWVYVSRWCREHGTDDLLSGIRRSIPPL
jgi:hypothetical protein